MCVKSRGLWERESVCVECSGGTVAMCRGPLIRKKGLEIRCGIYRNKLVLAAPGTNLNTSVFSKNDKLEGILH